MANTANRIRISIRIACDSLKAQTLSYRLPLSVIDRVVTARQAVRQVGVGNTLASATVNVPVALILR
jgi:hypothetical protein